MDQSKRLPQPKFWHDKPAPHDHTPLPTHIFKEYHAHKARIKESNQQVSVFVVAASILFIFMWIVGWFAMSGSAKKMLGPLYSPLVKKLAVYISPTPQLVETKITSWKTYKNMSKGYTFTYPSSMEVNDESGFLNSTILRPTHKAYDIHISEGALPYGFGRIATRTKTVSFTILDEVYNVQEKTIDDKQIVVDIPLNGKSDIHITIRTSENPNDQTFAYYEKDKPLIRKLISTFAYTNTSTFKTYVDPKYHYQFRYPGDDWVLESLPDGEAVRLSRKNGTYTGLTFSHYLDNAGTVNPDQYVPTAINGFDTFVNENFPEPNTLGTSRIYFIQLGQSEYIKVRMPTEDTNISEVKGKPRYPDSEDVHTAEAILNSFELTLKK